MLQVGKLYTFTEVQSSQRCYCYKQCTPFRALDGWDDWLPDYFILISEDSLLAFNSTEHVWTECKDQDPLVGPKIVADFHAKQKERKNTLENLKTERDNMLTRAQEVFNKAMDEVKQMNDMIEELEQMINY